ncbi:arginase family protein [Micromonospora sp. NPDC000089]|uniref:arginase family protein n=1 Tax=unclassified Micromonospora TaxID=2617518 RepID=UPI00368B5094
MMRRIAVLDAPTNLGLRPPTSTSVPGCAKAPGALRDHGLLARLRARDAGCLTPPRYDPGDWRPGDGVCHATEISGYSLALADRIGAIIDRGEFPVVLGGDCSVLLGSALAMHRLGEAVGGRIGLVFVDGHSDFRHPGNASYVGAAAGEDLALVTGRGQADLAAIEGRRPYFRDVDVVVLGIRAQDEYRLDLQAAGITTRPVPALRAEGAARTAQWAHEELADCAGYWVHIDVDVLDPAVMPAVDAPDPGGIAFAELEILLAGLVDTPHCLGVELTVFDPDYDLDGSYAAEIVNTVVAGLAPVSAPEAVPPRLLPAAPSPRRPRPVGPVGPGALAPRAPIVDSAPTVDSAVPPAAGSPAEGGERPDPVDERPDPMDDRPDPVDDRPPVEEWPGPAAIPVPAVAVEPVGPPASVGPGMLRRLHPGDDEPAGDAAADPSGDAEAPPAPFDDGYGGISAGRAGSAR